MSNVVEICHPLSRHHLAQLRDRKTSPSEFRACLRRLSVLLACEATRDLAVGDVEIQTPMSKMTGCELKQQIALVPVLRAGLGMVDPVLDLVPDAEVWHLGLYRDEKTAEPIEYYCKIPKTNPVDVAIILDPMLATGGSALVALETVQDWKVRSIKLISVIAARAGIDAVTARFPDVQIFVCAIDPELNANKFIVPGLGDAGDRTFNTLRGFD